MTVHRFPALRPILCVPHCLVAAALLAALAWTSPASAATFPPAFVVAGVPVDATAQNAVAAREAARAQGAATALRHLLQRLTAPADWDRLPVESAAAALDLVADVEVADEHSSAVRYLATYTFRFNPNGVRRLLKDAGLNFTEMPGKPVIVLPVLNDRDGARLWEEPNPWRDAWNAIPGRYGIVPWIVPTGDLQDVSAVNVASLAQPNPDQLRSLAQRYDNGDVVVATATLSGSHLAIGVARYAADGGVDTQSTSADGAAADPALFRAGVQAAVTLLENGWKQLTLPASGSADQAIEVEAAVTGPADWARLEDRLGKVPAIHDWRVDLMARHAVRLRLTAPADLALLKVALAQQDIVFTPGTPYAGLAIAATAETGTP
jgi:hypothetical protein